MMSTCWVKTSISMFCEMKLNKHIPIRNSWGQATVSLQISTEHDIMVHAKLPNSTQRHNEKPVCSFRFRRMLASQMWNLSWFRNSMFNDPPKNSEPHIEYSLCVLWRRPYENASMNSMNCWLESSNSSANISWY